MLGETPPFTMLHGSSFSAETARGYLPIGSPLPQIRSFNGRSIKTQRSVTPNEEPAWPPLHNVKRAPMRSYSIANDQSYKYGAPGPYGFALSPDQTIATTRRPQDDDGLLETCFAALVNGGRDDFYAAVGGPSSSGSSPSEKLRSTRTELVDLKKRHTNVLSELAAMRADYEELSQANKNMSSELCCAQEEITALRQLVSAQQAKLTGSDTLAEGMRSLTMGKVSSQSETALSGSDGAVTAVAMKTRSLEEQIQELHIASSTKILALQERNTALERKMREQAHSARAALLELMDRNTALDQKLRVQNHRAAQVIKDLQDRLAASGAVSDRSFQEPQKLGVGAAASKPDRQQERPGSRQELRQAGSPTSPVAGAASIQLQLIGHMGNVCANFNVPNLNARTKSFCTRNDCGRLHICDRCESPSHPVFMCPEVEQTLAKKVCVYYNRLYLRPDAQGMMRAQPCTHPACAFAHVCSRCLSSGHTRDLCYKRPLHDNNIEA